MDAFLLASWIPALSLREYLNRLLGDFGADVLWCQVIADWLAEYSLRASRGAVLMVGMTPASQAVRISR